MGLSRWTYGAGWGTGLFWVAGRMELSKRKVNFKFWHQIEICDSSIVWIGSHMGLDR